MLFRRNWLWIKLGVASALTKYMTGIRINRAMRRVNCFVVKIICDDCFVVKFKCKFAQPL
jgi:hypothetical protein